MVFACERKIGSGDWEAVERPNTDMSTDPFLIKIEFEDIRRFIHMFSKLYPDDAKVSYRVRPTPLPDTEANYQFVNGGLKRLNV